MENADHVIAPRLYDYLAQANPIIHQLNQICHEQKCCEIWPNFPDLSNLLADLSLNKNHDPNHSLLYGGQTTDFIEYLDGKPIAFARYFIIFTVARDKDNKFITYMPERMNCFLYKKEISFEICNFFDELFIHPINSTTGGRYCDGYSESKCKIAHGELENASDLKPLLTAPMKFRSFPKESILQIQKFTAKIDLDSNPDLEKLISGLASDECLSKYIDENNLQMKFVNDRKEQNNKMIQIAKLQAEQDAVLAELQIAQEAMLSKLQYVTGLSKKNVIDLVTQEHIINGLSDSLLRAIESKQYQEKINDLKKKIDSLTRCHYH